MYVYVKMQQRVGGRRARTVLPLVQSVVTVSALHNDVFGDVYIHDMISNSLCGREWSVRETTQL